MTLSSIEKGSPSFGDPFPIFPAGQLPPARYQASDCNRVYIRINKPIEIAAIAVRPKNIYRNITVLSFVRKITLDRFVIILPYNAA